MLFAQLKRKIPASKDHPNWETIIDDPIRMIIETIEYNIILDFLDSIF